MESQFKIIPLDKQEVPYHLLLEADPSKEIVDAYLHQSECFLGVCNGQVIGVVVLLKVAESTLEVKNIAISEEHQRKGYAKRLLVFAQEYALKQGFQKLIIATGNSSIGQLALYQKVEFEMHSIERDYFIKNYEVPIFENEIQCKHKVILEKILK